MATQTVAPEAVVKSRADAESQTPPETPPEAQTPDLIQQSLEHADLRLDELLEDFREENNNGWEELLNLDF